VSDTGPGIPAEDLPHVFEKFYRARTGARDVTSGDRRRDVPGVGLGLYIARTVVEQMGGRVDVKSEPGRGAVFTVWLPIVPHPHGEYRESEA
jgi:signal transduction histidine kinase